jgi:hypothetical protein
MRAPDWAKLRSLMGKLMWLATTCRPDIAYITNVLESNMSNPAERHLNTAKSAFRYLKRYHRGWSVSRSGLQSQLQAFRDADYPSDKSLESRTGFVVSSRAGAILWGSKLQQPVVLSTLEAELVAASMRTQRVLHVGNLFSSLIFLILERIFLAKCTLTMRLTPLLKNRLEKGTSPSRRSILM